MCRFKEKDTVGAEMISGFHKTVKGLKHVRVLRRARHPAVQMQDSEMQKWMLRRSPGFYSVFADCCSLATVRKKRQKTVCSTRAG